MKLGTCLKIAASVVAVSASGFLVLFPVFAKAKSYSGPMMTTKVLERLVMQHRDETGTWPEHASQLDPYLGAKLKCRSDEYRITRGKISADGSEADYKLWVKRGSREWTESAHLDVSR